jgi:hypothetical protein
MCGGVQTARVAQCYYKCEFHNPRWEFFLMGKAQGHPGHQKTGWFEGLTIVLEDNDDTLWCVIVSSTST